MNRRTNETGWSWHARLCLFIGIVSILIMCQALCAKLDTVIENQRELMSFQADTVRNVLRVEAALADCDDRMRAIHELFGFGEGISQKAEIPLKGGEK